MGWEIGWDHVHHRHIGYGVPAVCDHPSCTTEIDRGLAYACGGGVVGRGENCGLFFCYEHLVYPHSSQGEFREAMCERCLHHHPPFEPSEDTLIWCLHVLSDDSWAQWRAEHPELATLMSVRVREVQGA